MTEEEAHGWIEGRFGDKACTQVETFLTWVTTENLRQNLVAPSTVAQIWSRHAVDSAQLIALAPAEGRWIDIGTGGGFPGMIAAILRPCETVLVEPRRRRAEFLTHCAAQLGLSVRVLTSKVEAIEEIGAVISARAVAAVDKLLLAAARCATRDTKWLLPRGLVTDAELAALRRSWAGSFHVEQSLTNANSSILVLSGVYRR